MLTGGLSMPEGLGSSVACRWGEGGGAAGKLHRCWRSRGTELPPARGRGMGGPAGGATALRGSRSGVGGGMGGGAPSAA